ncbi:hypothetical protein L484_018816 [Morus notabilis]|uniref:Uncharacterized protein n=1 Tax=Morus notabilis TaxID=981085 RepID=W9R4E2_9ROSA|nr:hypothetical protein L484_018816 [Morus notabilis]
MPKAGGPNSFTSQHVNAEIGIGSITRDISQLEFQKALMEKAKKEIRKKLNEWSSTVVTKPATKEEGNRYGKANDGEEKSSRINDTGDDQSNCGEP